jgi:two-component system CheB/CheR fusion protein
MAEGIRRVLVVEDSPDIREALCWLLADAGFEVVDRERGREALRLIGAMPFDAVVTDLGLPDMPGDAVIRGIRAMRNSSCRIVAYSAEPDLRRALRAGADAVVEKPADFDTLLSALTGPTTTAVA